MKVTKMQLRHHEEMTSAHAYTIKPNTIAELEVFPNRCLLLRNETAEYAQVTVGDAIPRAAVAAALVALLTQAEAGAEKWLGHHNEANIYQDFIESISATIAKLGLQEERDDYLR